MKTNTSNMLTPILQALTQMINQFPAWGTRLTFINGILSGYSAYLGMDTDKKVAVVVLITNFNWVEKIGHNLLLRVAAATDAGRKEVAAHSDATAVENKNKP